MFFKKYKDKIKNQEYEIKFLSNEVSRLRANIQERIDMTHDLQEELDKLKKEKKLVIKQPIDVKKELFLKIIKAGRNDLIKKHHPDKGGDRKDFEMVELAYQELKKLEISEATIQKEPLYSPFYNRYADMAAAKYNTMRGYAGWRFF